MGSTIGGKVEPAQPANEAEELHDEIDRLRLERDALRRDVEGIRALPQRRSRIRRITAAVLIVISVAAFVAAVPGWWARRVVFDTDRYVELTAQIAEQPAVQERLAVRITDATFEALNVEERLASALADVRAELGFLAGPITEAVRDRVRTRVEDVLASETFLRLWGEANRLAHAQIVAALRGDTETVRIDESTVTLNVLPIVNEALRGLTGLASELVGRPVELPEIDAETVPAEAVQRIEGALGVDLPDNLGAIEVYDADQVREVQQAVALFERWVVFLVLLWIAALIAAAAVSQRRRRTILQLFVAFAVVLVVERRFAIASVEGIVGDLDPDAQPAGAAITDVILGDLLRYTAWLLGIALTVVAVALVTGPYAWAVLVRRGVADVAGAVAGTIRGSRGGPVAEWAASRRDALMFAGAAVSIVLLLVVDLSLVGVSVTIVLLGLYELAVWRTAETFRAVSVP